MLSIQLDLLPIPISTASVESLHALTAHLLCRALLPAQGPVRNTGKGSGAPGQLRGGMGRDQTGADQGWKLPWREKYQCSATPR